MENLGGKCESSITNSLHNKFPSIDKITNARFYCGHIFFVFLLVLNLPILEDKNTQFIVFKCNIK